MICPKCQSDNAIRNGGGRCYCRDCGKFSMAPPERTPEEISEATMARQGWAPDHGISTPLPLGQKLRGTSTLIDKRTGEQVLQWVKSNEDAEEQAAIREAIIGALCERVPREKLVKGPSHTVADLVNQYTITDYHLGMLAWHEETGADWDTEIAENLLVAWFAKAISLAPAASVGIFAQLGDFLHWDGFDAVTPAHKHLLDADTRFPKLVRVAIRALRRIVSMLLAKHDFVHLIMAEGNHDPASSVYLREMLHAFYEDDPRITVDVSPDPYYAFEHGATALLYHHGHKLKPEQIDDTLVAKFRELFGRTRHVYAHMGHMHHDKRFETKLMIVEQHRTLAAPDAYSSRGGWMSGRDAKVITYSKRFGEVGRVTVSPGMLEAAA